MPDEPARRWASRADPRLAVRTAVVWDTLDVLVTEHTEAIGRPALDVVDVGGGTGGFAVPLAGLGHGVTVIDPSPDALAALQRRAADAGVAGRIRAEQGDAGALAAVVGASSADLLLCHGVLEHVDDPKAAVLDMLEVLRPGGLLSALVAQRLGAVLARALSGRFGAALRVLEDPAGRGGPGDPVSRRFDRAALLALFEAEPVRLRAVHGVRLFTDLLPGALVDGDLEAGQALLDLERATSGHPELAAVSAQLHVVLQRLDVDTAGPTEPSVAPS
ncbi:MAG TPA: methyltransferase domain-containing protein [Kineosporiaceae bacterium]|nr:methyltransferase domain-containing protein [Kineosporiaceae bacterium]